MYVYIYMCVYMAVENSRRARWFIRFKSKHSNPYLCASLSPCEILAT